MTRLSVEKRAAILLEDIRAGRITNWRTAMSQYPDENWNTLRVALKKLRDEGLIAASAEYNHISLASKARS